MSPTKSIPKISRILTPWLNRINRFIYYLRLWMWAAVHEEDFYLFHLSITGIISLSWWDFTPHFTEFLTLEIGFRKPSFYTFIPSQVERKFLFINGLDYDDFHGHIPF